MRCLTSASWRKRKRKKKDMKVALGNRSQFYGEASNPAMADRVQDTVFQAAAKAGLKLTPIYTGVRGPDVWFEIADELVTKLEEFVITLPETGTPSRKTDNTMGEYLDIPLILEQAPRRGRFFN
jgi:hypothetical protein